MRPKAGLTILIIISLVVLMGSIPFSETAAKTEPSTEQSMASASAASVPNNQINAVAGGPGFVSLTGLSFVPAFSSNTIGRLNTYLYNPESNLVDYLAPIDLPNGAKVKRIVFYYNDFVKSVDANITLQRVELQYGTLDNIVGTGSLGSTGSGMSQSDVVVNGEIDLQNYAYIIRAKLPGGTSGNIGLFSVRVDYEYAGYAPIVCK